MSDHPKDKDRPGPYEVGYGKPPVSSRFVKGKSGNPRGRRKKLAPKPTVDEATRDQFLSEADRPVTIRDGDKFEEIPVAKGVMRAQVVAALKGSPVAQKHFLDRNERHRNELASEIKADHESWKAYVVNYEKLEKAGQLPEDFPHPDDLVFEEGCHVTFRGGDPFEAARDREIRTRFRDVCILQAEKDRRNFLNTAKPTQRVPIFISEYLAHSLNSSLPKRLQLDDVRLIMRMNKARTLRKRELEQRLRKHWADLGIPQARNLITPPVNPLLIELEIDPDKLSASRGGGAR